jgi:hypothetical protein
MQKITNGYNYFVNDEGKVFNSKGKEITTCMNNCGYLTVRLWKNNHSRVFTIHRLVALALIPNPDNKEMVNHIDGNKKNNRVSNLEWVTRSENTLHSHRIGLQVSKKGSDHHSSIFSDEIVHQVCKMIEEGFKARQIVEKLNVPLYLIKNIKYQNSWKHISSLYKIK